jgi:protein-S-isoprenylcysteine O-methyltransferase Ste14
MFMKLKFFIDTQKGVTTFFVFGMIVLYQQWDNPTAWLYLALHGTYGFLWVLKSRVFPDQSWEEKVGLGFGLMSWAALCLYWVAPWMLNWRGVQAPGWYMALCVSLYAFGVFIHFASDMQKYVCLRTEPGQLITDGMFKRSRNINYFGELLIYSGFGLLAMHWIPMAILFIWVTIYWLPRMRRKDLVLAKLTGFEDYKKHSRLFIPFIF